MKLKNKVIIVTGASKGVGREICALLAKEGAIVVAVSRSRAGIVSCINNIGGKAIWVKADVSDEKQFRKAFVVAKKKFGRIYGLINNAGVLFHKPIEKTSYKEFDLTIGVNVRGTWTGCKLAREYIKKGVIKRV